MCVSSIHSIIIFHWAFLHSWHFLRPDSKKFGIHKVLAGWKGTNRKLTEHCRFNMYFFAFYYFPPSQSWNFYGLSILTFLFSFFFSLPPLQTIKMGYCFFFQTWKIKLGMEILPRCQSGQAFSEQDKWNQESWKNTLLGLVLIKPHCALLHHPKKPIDVSILLIPLSVACCLAIVTRRETQLLQVRHPLPEGRLRISDIREV